MALGWRDERGAVIRGTEAHDRLRAQGRLGTPRPDYKMIRVELTDAGLCKRCEHVARA